MAYYRIYSIIVLSYRSFLRGVGEIAMTVGYTVWSHKGKSANGFSLF